MNVFLVVTSLHIFQLKFCRYTLSSSPYMICVIYLSFLEVIMHLTIEAHMESIWSHIQQWADCLVVGLWLKRQAGKRGSTLHAPPSILCLFGGTSTVTEVTDVLPKEEVYGRSVMLPLFSELSLATIRNCSEHFVECRQTPCLNFLRTATKICFQAPICQMYISAVPLTIKVGLTKGTRTVQTDSDSENRRQSAQWNVLCLTVQVRIMVAGGSMQESESDGLPE